MELSFKHEGERFNEQISLKDKVIGEKNAKIV